MNILATTTLDNIPEVKQQALDISTGIPQNLVSTAIAQKSESSIPHEDQDKDNGAMCPICFDNISESEIIKPLECQHAFCRSCLVEYLKSKIDSFKVLNISCPSSECPCILTEGHISGILDTETMNKYKHFVEKKTIKKTDADEIKFCPKPGCAKSFKPNAKSAFTICKCGEKICNLCANPMHEGKSCLEVIDPEFEEYTKKEGVKFCMICKTHVVKVEGCMHITCPICDYEWCWECGREYKNSKHQGTCPKKWSPKAPSASIVNSLMMRLWSGSVWKKIFLILGGIILSPLILIVGLLIWPLFRFFDPAEDLDKKKPLKSFMIIFGSILLGIVFSPFVLAFGALYLLAQIIIVPMKMTLKYDLERTNDNNIHEVEQAQETKKEVRWMQGDAKQFVYTGNSRPELETDANTRATEGDIEAQILRRQPAQNQNRGVNGRAQNNRVFQRVWNDYNAQPMGGFHLY